MFIFFYNFNVICQLKDIQSSQFLSYAKYGLYHDLNVLNIGEYLPGNKKKLSDVTITINCSTVLNIILQIEKYPI